MSAACAEGGGGGGRRAFSRFPEALCASRRSRALWSATSMANVLSGPRLQLLPVWQLPDLLR